MIRAFGSAASMKVSVRKGRNGDFVADGFFVLASMKAPPNRKGNMLSQVLCLHLIDDASMKALPKRKGNVCEDRRRQPSSVASIKAPPKGREIRA